MQNSILEQAKVAEQNYIIQFLKVLKLYKKNRSRQSTLSIHIKIDL